MPLAYHAHPFIVQDEDLDRQTILGRGGHFLNIHLDRCFAGDIDNQRVRIAHLCTDRCGQAIAHGSQAAAGEPFVRGIKMEMLCRPHLVLPNFCRDDRRFVFGGREQAFNRILRHDFLRAAGVAEAVDCAPAFDTCPPVIQCRSLVLTAFPDFDHLPHRRANIRHDGQINAYRFVHRTAVDIDVDFDAVG